jgi:hypothetical protein
VKYPKERPHIHRLTERPNPVIARSEATKQSSAREARHQNRFIRRNCRFIFARYARAGLLRFARNDG